MSAVEVITAAGAAVGIMSGGIGVVLAVRADSRAKRANQSAQTANSLAEEANRIAGEANQFAQESNMIMQRQSAQQNEHWVVHWATAWETLGGHLVLTNKGSHAARQPSFVIQAHDFHQVLDGLDDVGAGNKIELALPKIVEMRRRTKQNNRDAAVDSALLGVSISRKAFSRTLTITATWRTGEDAVRQTVLQQTAN